MKWVALFSQSGSEIVSICKNTGVVPDAIITNNQDVSKWHVGMHKLPRVAIMKSSDIHNFLEKRNDTILVTLHGYLRIIPCSVCNKHMVFNGHPGDIIKYPILKGKNPQKKAIELNLPSTGVVIHRATEELDSGDIYRYARVDISTRSEEELVQQLKQTSIKLWTDFMIDILYDLRYIRGGI